MPACWANVFLVGFAPVSQTMILHGDDAVALSAAVHQRASPSPLPPFNGANGTLGLYLLMGFRGFSGL